MWTTQQLLKRQFSGIQGLQDVAVSYTTKNHWVTVSNGDKEECGVTPVDSTNNKGTNCVHTK
jgi:hypothetical protein